MIKTGIAYTCFRYAKLRYTLLVRIDSVNVDFIQFLCNNENKDKKHQRIYLNNGMLSYTISENSFFEYRDRH